MKLFPLPPFFIMWKEGPKTREATKGKGEGKTCGKN